MAVVTIVRGNHQEAKGSLFALHHMERCGGSTFILHRNMETARLSHRDTSIMRIGILSDTHDQVQRTRSAVAMLAECGAEILIHCGDLTIADVVHECSTLPCYFVFGNCDHDRDSLRQAMTQIGGTCLERGGLVSLDGHRLAVTHGDSDHELRRLAELEPDYLFSGHTHVASDVQKGPTRWINPGACTALRSGQSHLSILQAIMLACCQ